MIVLPRSPSPVVKPQRSVAANIRDSVRDVLELLRDELDLAMALAGCRSIDEISLDLLRPE